MDETLTALLERQARRWEIDGGAGMPRPHAPVVAVSRWAGARGEEVAQRVAEWLDYGLFGPENIDRLVADRTLRERLLPNLDPAARGEFSARVEAVRARVPEAPPALVEVVARLGIRGMAVMLGRGAAAILPSTRALRVLVVAPDALRAERLANDQGIDLDEARACVASADAARISALAAFGLVAEDLTHFDLVLNTEALSIDAVAALVVDALRRRFPLR